MAIRAMSTNVLFGKYINRLGKKNFVNRILILYIAIALIIGAFIPTVYSQDEIEWNAILNIDSPDGTDDTVIFGEVQDSNDGIPPDSHDVPKTLPPMEPYVQAWFDDNLPTPYTKLWHDYREYPDNNKIWNLTIDWRGDASTNVTISWNIDDLNESEYDSILLCNDTGFILEDMFVNDTYTFNCPAGTLQHFKIICTVHYNLTVNIIGSGSVDNDPVNPYSYGDNVTLNATADAGWEFDSWSDDLSGNINPTNITMDSDKNVTATFTQIDYTLDIIIVDNGTVNIDPDQPTYHYGDMVNIEAVPDAGWEFNSWSGDVNSSNDLETVTMDEDKEITASFSSINFTIIVLPDTQFYSQTYPTIYSNQTQWIVEHKDELNIKFVCHEGDIVNNALDVYQWENANAAMSLLEDSNSTSLPDGIPYSILPGNHDYPTIHYNQCFNVLRFNGRSYYGGYYSDNNENNYVLFSACGMDFIAISIGWDPGTDQLNWADNLLKTYSNRRAVVISHYILEGDGSWSNQGQLIYNALKDNQNLFLMLCGHVLGENMRTDVYDENMLFTLLADYQDRPNGGNGWLRIMEFCPETDEIKIKTYSPYLDQFEQDADSEFTLMYDMNGSETIYYTLTINTIGNGTVDPAEGTHSYPAGTVVDIEAVADAGWEFDSWSDDLSGNINPTNITMDSDKNVTATFTQIDYILSVTMSGTGSGAVEYSPSGPFYYGDVVTLWANASTGSSFIGWSGDLSGSTTPDTLVMDGNKNVDAEFTLSGGYTLSVTKSGTGSGAVEYSPSGPFYYGDVVTLWANASTGSSFIGWSGDLSGSTTPDTLVMDGNKNVDAEFTLSGGYTLSVTKSGTGSGAVEYSPSGPFYYGDVVTLWANASTGSSFIGWSGDLSGSTTPDTLVMDGNKNVDAEFTLSGGYTLSVTKSGTGSGAVEYSPSGPFYYGDVVTLWANASTGSSFIGWSGDLSGSTTPDTLVMDGNKNVDAEFTLSGGYTLSVTKSGTGSGAVEYSPSGPFYYGDVVTLWANASTGSSFIGWSGDLSGSTTPDTLVMDGNKNVDAEFTLSGGYTLSVTKSGTGSGAVEYSPSGPFYYGDVVTLWANASTGSSFIGWSGDLSGSTTPDTLVMDGNKNVDAEFTLSGGYTLSVTKSGTGSGAVEYSPSGPFYYGDVVTLWANASTGSSFIGWSGDLSGSTTPDTLVMDGNKNVDAEFTLSGGYTLSVTKSGTGSGAVEYSPSGPFYYGDVVTLWANASTGSSFIGWSGDLSGSTTPDTLVMDGNKNVDAEFTLSGGYTLSVTKSGTGSGAVEYSPSGPFYYGDVVTLWANASTGSSFIGWSGDLSGSTTPDTLVMDGNKNVDAEFTLSGGYTLSVTKSGTGSGAVEYSPSGPFYYGDVVTLWANASTGSSFIGWSGDLSGSTTPDTLVMDGNKNVDAEFTLSGGYTLSVTKSGTGSGAVEYSPSGPFYYGDVVTLWANASTGSSFIGWSGDLSGSTTPDTLVMDGNKNVDAEFTLSGGYTLSVTKSGTGSGAVEYSPSGPFYYGDVVTLWANASTGSSFIGWSGDLSGSTTPDTLVMDGNKNVDAEFTLSGGYTLSVTKSGTGSGAVEYSPSGPFYYGDVVTLWANASTGSSFIGWSGDLSGSTTPDTLVMDGNKNVDAEFTLSGGYTLSVTKSGTGSGAVEYSPSGPFYYGDVVTLWANASTGSSFIGWSGDLSGSTTPDTLVMDGNKNVDAEFTLSGGYTLSVTKSGTGSGAVEYSPSGPFYYGDVVTLWANASTGSSFIGWSGDLSGSTTPDTLVMDGNKNVDAEFTLSGGYTLSVTKSGTGSGAVEYSPSGPFYYGDVVTLWANASTGSSFIGWSGDLSGSTTPDTLVMDGNKNVDAEFTLSGGYTLSVTKSGTGSGAVEYSPSGPFYYGDVVTLWANASTGSSFIGWSGDLSGSTTPDTLVMDGNKNVDAEFTLSGGYTLSVTKSGTGSGAVEYSPSGPFYYGDVVTLWANASTGSSFIGWSGDLSGSTTPDTLVMDGNKNVDAEFTLSGGYTLSVTKSGTGSGAVEYSPSGPFYYGDVVTLWANASTGSSFIGWSGDLSGSTTPDTLVMDGNKNVDAEFTLSGGYTLSVTKSGTGSGAVEYSPSGPFYYGDVVTLWANASTGSSFIGWSGDLSGSTTPDTVTMTGNMNVDAQFDLDGPFTFTTTMSGTGSGAVEYSPSGPFYYGDVVTLETVPDDSSYFSGWSGDISGSTNPDTITITGNMAVDAEFTLEEYTLTITTSGDGSGSVTGDPTGPYNYGDVVTLEAIPGTGSKFEYWSEDLSGSNNPATITVDSDKIVTVHFKKEGSGGHSGSPPPSNQPPIADASAGEPYNGFVGGDVTFNGSLSYDRDAGTIISWQWEFGDGTEGDGETISHSYSDAGNYTVILTVTDDDGATGTDATYAIITQKADNVPSKPILEGPTTGNKSTSYVYTVVSTDIDNHSISYIFNWGDNTDITTNYLPNGTIVTQNHAWTAAGKYTIWVQAIDDTGMSSEITYLTILIDAWLIDDEIDGYLINNDGDGIYNSFYNSATGQETNVEQDNDGNYLIDIGGDGEWDFIYDPETGELMDYELGELESSQPQGYNTALILLVVFIALVTAILLIFIKINKDKKER